ncbi:50S ribosomal protein L21, mitochondrial-like [Zingiber officinale]|uniref:Large ribosomal subunit protein bL21m n=1 Tax=Zingiber officinale TaxID=94328 RepID=A0A8J5KR87_ZINOF|nr:50S ribosomal protein L21, mitochondrial-like [Zingiber officinale]KAG6489032.1 hypothetical protein ZIOFF_050290 [Zingiber officinale]
MAGRCLGTLARHVRARLISTAALEIPQTSVILRSLDLAINPGSPLNLQHAPVRVRSLSLIRVASPRFFSSRPTNSSDEEEDDAEYEEGDEEYEEEETEHTLGPKSIGQSGKTEEEKVAEAAEIGYNVIGPLDSSENPFKSYEPYFAVVQIGSHQFKVSNGDSIFTERLKYCEVNDKLNLHRVLMLGSKTQTIIGRPMVPEAMVHAVVEEHALDAKVIIFKKKRRKNYRRTKGHRQELTKLRITDIQGIDKSEIAATVA